MTEDQEFHLRLLLTKELDLVG
ncbi:predicted protein [Fibroporia radiculosa]|uniref:Uncharacterized protein n=1 Tax=Fibroporia radiculosa TaxID=599839 RepID=J7RW84_9APHY|nr:predicted protein [Fibroporia radiculosa]